MQGRTVPGGLLTTAVFVCLAFQPALAQTSGYDESSTMESHAAIQADQPFIPYPLFNPQSNGGLAFDLGGSDVRKLQLRLSQSLGIESLSGASLGEGGALMAGSSLNYEINEQLSLTGGGAVAQGDPGFQSVGSIHCVNGTLDAVSYRASNCYFIDDRESAQASVVDLGARYQITEGASASINLFHSESGFNNTYGAVQGNGGAVIDPGTLGIAPGNPLFSGFDPALGMQKLESELTGIDLEFQVGISTDRAGDMVVGLQLTRVLEGGYETAYLNTPGITTWNIAQPYDSAGLSFDWYKGSFSGGVQSYYREQVDFLGRPSLEAFGTFDVHFTWRAPWNASLSVGASNVLNAGVEENSTNEPTLTDPFESIYGRIPYVRYKQDL